jgi:Tfp pilus assembly protein PilO
MRNLDKQQLIILAVSIVLGGGFVVFKYVPIIREKHALHKQMDQQALVIEQVCSQSALWPELKYKKVQIENQLAPFAEKIPQGRNFAQLWQQVAEVMNAYNLQEQVVQPGDELKSGQLCSIPLTIECKGSLVQLFTFIQELENLHRLIRFEKIQIENDKEFTGFVKMNAEASIYYQPDSTDNG